MIPRLPAKGIDQNMGQISVEIYDPPGSVLSGNQHPDTMRVSWPHYDAPEKRRAAALEAGAIALDRHQTVVMSKVIIGQWFGMPCDPLAGHRARQSPMLPRLEAWLAEELGSSR
jgi:hypothetical protein